MVIGSRLWDRRVQSSAKDPPYMCCLLHVKSGVIKRLSASVVRKFGDEMPAQVPSSSSDRGSKLRDSSQKRPRVTSKRDINITKLKQVTKMKLSTFLYTTHTKKKKKIDGRLSLRNGRWD
ncbi:hypothetical protein AVEN_242404-1 [Araneus ventricosus]|uniref:Uncharacterized protein n=1 Tax=Araneus ventricosus TaxID=182803 RepID=A0A4Y2ITY2_ARAVE|nr:hypothetical protein AVEN_242404-1 [Araneus ventricosus]